MDGENEYGWWIHKLSHQIKRRLDARLGGVGITGVQGRVLHFIQERYEKQPVFQKDVEKAFTLRRSTATGILQLLEKGELIRRESVAYDARLKSLVPTEKALALHEEMRASIREMEGLLVQNIDAQQRQIFLQVIRQMSENLDA